MCHLPKLVHNSTFILDESVADVLYSILRSFFNLKTHKSKVTKFSILCVLQLDVCYNAFLTKRFFKLFSCNL
jgi:hypothetical protein